MGNSSEKIVRPRPGDALIIVDVQNDFLPGGALGVPKGDEIVPVINRYLEALVGKDIPVFATRDWHPEKHCSFKEQGGPWPPHCVASTRGAEFAPGLFLPDSTTIISKGTDVDRDAYSGFQGTDLDHRFKSLNIRRLFIGGLATDYCVLSTVKDALRRGYEVMLLQDAIRAVDVKPGDGDRAIDEMIRLGAKPITRDMLRP
ncbi:MAG: nicotinamidase [Deltaproteobacteria bacterium]|nr:nicotinamidase [Deltaproteobacteria bacterium]MBW2138707.1 nicotinamidase [Deltaproteobacteria bacterium]